MLEVKISVVSYLNSKPFIYGIEHSGNLANYQLELDIPSVCAEKLINNKVDIGLIPVAVIPHLNYFEILTDYCIGADGAVGSVVLYSNVPLTEIKKVVLDYQSRTSVALVQQLAKRFWNINPVWENAKENYENEIAGTTAAVIIGDRTFGLENKYRFKYDLSEEWKKYTSLPFVFACWVANKPLPDDFKLAFAKAIKFGVDNIDVVVNILEKEKTYPTDVSFYLNQSISYHLDEKKRKALKLFLEYLG